MAAGSQTARQEALARSGTAMHTGDVARGRLSEKSVEPDGKDYI